MTHPAPCQSRLPPNEDQLLASDPLRSVWVNASAGAGKTTILTKRVMRLLLSGVRPEKILCLTYTRAGAAEMANRVTEKLSAWTTCDDDTLQAELEDMQDARPSLDQAKEARRLFSKVLACPGGLRIRTIHSFCQEILSRFPLEAGLPPHFSLIDEQDLLVLNDQVLDELLNEIGDNPAHELAPALAALVSAQGEKGFDKMLAEVMHARGRHSKALEKFGGLKNLISHTRALLDLTPGETSLSLIKDSIGRIPEDAMRILAKRLVEGTSSHQKRGQDLADYLALSFEDRVAGFEDYWSIFLTKIDRAPRKSFADKTLLQHYPDIHDVSMCEALRLTSLFERIEATTIAETTAHVLTFGAAFADRLNARKAARAALDYDDLILHTESLLTQGDISPWILYKLDNGIDHILVDEAQDTSLAQWNIVEALASEFFAGEGAQGDKTRTLFVVGDEKQSIFSFQNADPEAFRSRRVFFEQALAEGNNKLHRIGLHTSYRSAPAVLRAVDQIFAKEAIRQGVSNEVVHHQASKNRDGSDKAGRVEVWPLLVAPKETKDHSTEWIVPTGYEEETDPQAELADRIAKKIKHWLSHKVVLPELNRAVQACDIMILLRNRGRFADLMVRALKSHNVPVTGVDRMHLIKQLPVMDLLAMLRFALLPEDDLNLAALLRSPLLGLSEDDLMSLAIPRKGSLWQSVQNDPKTSAHAAYLTDQLRLADTTTPFAFLSHILNAPCPSCATSGRQALWQRLGDEALDPIEELLNAAQNFASGRAPSLENFLHWLTKADAQIKRELDHGNTQNGGMVRIMTVHASKGLEAPIVFLPDTSSVPRSVDLPKFQWTEEGIPLFLPREPSFGKARALWLNARNKQMEEYRRLFYVALTRAANRLYLCGWLNGNSAEASSESWYSLAATSLADETQEHWPEETQGSKAAIILADPVLARSVSVDAPEPTTPTTDLPTWALSQLISPSAPQRGKAQAAATPDAAFARGKIIHRLLQSLPSLPPERHGAAVEKFLAQPRHGLDAETRKEISQEVLALLADERFSILFSGDALAEAPLTGTLNGVPAFRQVDRLCFYGNEVWIVDYKTNRPPPENEADIPEAYRRQLQEYRLLLSGIFPDKKVRSFLLWTYAPRLMECRDN